MLDLETMGTVAGSPIIAIGAVMFGKEGLGEEFYTQVSLESCAAYGMRPSGSTVIWWMKQSDEARAAFKNNDSAPTLPEALVAFKKWLPDDSKVWGNGADFDNVLLAAAYSACGILLPWKYYNNRCYRTMRELFKNVPVERVGVHHNAVDDAKTQAMHLMAGMRALRGGQ
jgi:exodeoxyribonuclease VIII